MKAGEETLISRKYSLAYLRHLFKAWESLAGTLMSLHNLEYLHIITRRARQAIIAWTYEEFRKRFYEGYSL
jgi:queuine tRNA-ribosyltransferase